MYLLFYIGGQSFLGLSEKSKTVFFMVTKVLQLQLSSNDAFVLLLSIMDNFNRWYTLFVHHWTYIQD